MHSSDLASLIEALRPFVDATQLAELQARGAGPGQLLADLVERRLLTPYQAEHLARGDSSKLLLGQYVILDLLGEGGMGQVFKARHQRMKRTAAVKVIRKDTTAGPQAVQRFNQEIEATAQLSHPNVVLAYDANEADDTLFFVMEYVEGIDLGRLVQNIGPLPVGAACDFIRQAALGLEHAHERGLVHRDIKPSNLLLTYADATVKVLDLGLARLQQAEAAGSLTHTGMVMGTPDFISPEQGRDSRAVDIRSDIYSLGCTLYFLLSGQVPFPEGTFTEKLLKHNMEEPISLAKRRPEMPEDVAAIVARMMAKRPADRYQTPREAAEALTPFAERMTSAECYRSTKPAAAGSASSLGTSRVSPTQTPAQSEASSEHDARTDKASVAPARRPQPAESFTAPQPNPSVREWKTLVPERLAPPKPPVSPPAPPRRKALPLAVAAILGIAFAGAVFAFLRPRNPDPETNVAVNVATQPEPTHLVVTNTKKEPPPATKSVPLPTKKEPPEKIEKKIEPPEPAKPYLGRLVDEFRDEKNKQPLKVALSADGRRVFAGWGDQLRLWDLDPFKPVTKPRQSTALPNLHTSLGQSTVQAVALAPDGHRVLIGTTMDVYIAGKTTPPLPVLVLWDADLANEPKLLEAYKLADKERNVKYVTAVAFSPQGNRVLAGSQDRTVRLWDLDNGAKRILGEHKATVNCVTFSPDGRFALSGGWDNQVILWDLVEKRQVHVLGGKSGHQNIVSCVAFSPDGRFAVSGGRDRLLKLWDLKAGKWVRDFEGHGINVRCAVFSPDGKRILSGGDDDAIRLWDIDQVEPIAKLRDHRKSVVGLAFSADGKYAASVSEDNTIRRWELPK